MREALPVSDFEWMTKDEIACLNIDDVPDDAPTGYILEEVGVEEFDHLCAPSRSPYPPNDGCLDFSGAEVVVSAGRALRNAQLRMNQPGEAVNVVVQDNMEAAMRARTQSPTAPAKDASPKKRQPGVDSCWHVAVLAGLVAFIVTTSHAASGFFYVGFMDEFGVDREAASWPSNAITALSHLSGILLAVLQGRVTLFQIFFVGGVLVWFGILASVFVPNMAWMTVTFGVINGLGLGLTIITMGVLLTMYFDRYRGVASGIKFAGMSGSGLAFPKFLSYLQQKYGFRGMLLVYGGIATHVTAFGLLLKEPPWICLKTRGPENGKVKTLGLFRDDGGSYDNLYRMYGGILLLLSGIFLLLVCAERSLNDVWTPGQKAQEGGQRNGPISLSAVRMTPPQL
ncbi:hypothetical protein HPB47_027634 [Ixodes persulcatus]|uniref:Uncharacterized protein n=1 Tax=Ixodes persulcatus TaxID=34615 RepID=A0AC60PVY2_IXOPE|nr:hypothetical protein HPB47_027634 [Ixodes persulcatus]